VGERVADFVAFDCKSQDNAGSQLRGLRGVRAVKKVVKGCQKWAATVPEMRVAKQSYDAEFRSPTDANQCIAYFLVFQWGSTVTLICFRLLTTTDGGRSAHSIWGCPYSTLYYIHISPEGINSWHRLHSSHIQHLRKQHLFPSHSSHCSRPFSLGRTNKLNSHIVHGLSGSFAYSVGCLFGPTRPPNHLHLHIRRLSRCMHRPR
jgi:hypothetical protein